MSLRRRVLLGCLLVAAVLLGTDVVLASTFRSFLLGRVDQQVVQAADPLVHGRFRGSFAGRIPSPSSTPTGEQRVYTEYYIGLAAADGTVKRWRSSADGLRCSARARADSFGAERSFSRRPGPRCDTVPSAATRPM